MLRTAKAMTVAAMIATGLPLLTETASAQTPYTYYYIQPVYCWSYKDWAPVASDGSWIRVDAALIYDRNNGFYVRALDSAAIPTLLKMCYDRTPFWAEYVGGSVPWLEFYFNNGLL